MGILPAKYCRNPCYVEDMKVANRHLPEGWFARNEIDEAAFVVLYLFERQDERIVLSDDFIDVVSPRRSLRLPIGEIARIRAHGGVNDPWDETDRPWEEDREWKLGVDRVGIEMTNGDRHTVDVRGHRGVVRDAFGFSQLVGILMRRRRKRLATVETARP